MKPRGLQWRLVLALACAWATGCWNSSGAFAAVVAVQDPVDSGGYVTVPVSVTAGTNEQPTSLQFDLNYDSGNFSVVTVEPGASAVQAGKSAIFNQTTAGTITVVVAGLNQTLISDGVIATIRLSPLGDGGVTPLFTLDSVVISDPFGKPINAVYEDASALTQEEQSTPNEDTAPSSDTDAEESATEPTGGEAYVSDNPDTDLPQTPGTTETNASNSGPSGTRGHTSAPESHADARRAIGGPLFGMQHGGAQAGTSTVPARGISGSVTGSNSGTALQSSSPDAGGRSASRDLRYGSSGEQERAGTLSPNVPKLLAMNPEHGIISGAVSHTNQNTPSVATDQNTASRVFGRNAMLGFVLLLAVVVIGVSVRTFLVK
jgi:hypothetical protein